MIQQQDTATIIKQLPNEDYRITRYCCSSSSCRSNNNIRQQQPLQHQKQQQENRPIIRHHSLLLLSKDYQSTTTTTNQSQQRGMLFGATIPLRHFFHYYYRLYHHHHHQESNISSKRRRKRKGTRRLAFCTVLFVFLILPIILVCHRISIIIINTRQNLVEKSKNNKNGSNILFVSSFMIGQLRQPDSLSSLFMVRRQVLLSQQQQLYHHYSLRRSFLSATRSSTTLHYKRSIYNNRHHPFSFQQQQFLSPTSFQKYHFPPQQKLQQLHYTTTTTTTNSVPSTFQNNNTPNWLTRTTPYSHKRKIQNYLYHSTETKSTNQYQLHPSPTASSSKTLFFTIRNPMDYDEEVQQELEEGEEEEKGNTLNGLQTVHQIWKEENENESIPHPGISHDANLPPHSPHSNTNTTVTTTTATEATVDDETTITQSIYDTWYNEYVIMMNDIMNQDRVLNYNAGKKQKSNKKKKTKNTPTSNSTTSTTSHEQQQQQQPQNTLSDGPITQEEIEMAQRYLISNWNLYPSSSPSEMTTNNDNNNKIHQHHNEIIHKDENEEEGTIAEHQQRQEKEQQQPVLSSSLLPDFYPPYHYEYDDQEKMENENEDNKKKTTKKRKQPSFRTILSQYQRSFWYGTTDDIKKSETFDLNRYQQQQQYVDDNDDQKRNSGVSLFHSFTNPQKQCDYALCCLSYVADICARERKMGPCYIAWTKVKQCGLVPRENCISTYMYVFSLFYEQNQYEQEQNHKETNHDMILKNNKQQLNDVTTTTTTTIIRQKNSLIQQACFEAATLHDLLYEPNEKTITLRIKTFIANHDPYSAECILESLPDKNRVEQQQEQQSLTTTTITVASVSSSSKSDWKRLRTFLPILQYYCTDSHAAAATTTTTTQPDDGQDNNDKLKMHSILRLFQQMKRSEGVHLDGETYTMILSTLARRGCFINDEKDQKSSSSSLPMVHEHNYPSKGPALLNYIMTNMAEDILEVDEACAIILYNAFMTGYIQNNQQKEELDPIDSSSSSKSIPSAHIFIPDKERKEISLLSSNDRIVLGRVTIDSTSSLCPMTSAKLRLFALNDIQREQVHDTLLDMAAQQHEEYAEKLLIRRQTGFRKRGKYEKNKSLTLTTTTTTTSTKNNQSNKNSNGLTNNNNNDNDDDNDNVVVKGNTNSNYEPVILDRDGQFAYQELLKFSHWLRDHERNITATTNIHSDGTTDDDTNGSQRPYYTAIVDGPNVAYFGHGDVHYSQVQIIVNQLKMMGERPLVIMPQKYVSDKFWLALGYYQELNEQEKYIRDELLEKKEMYVVSNSCLDDYYWMLASVAYNNNNINNNDYVKVESNKLQEQQKRFPGLRPLLITNDQMRDHRLALLLEPRSFRRWKSCHIVNYYIEPYQQNEWEDKERLIQFIPANFFSREIQGNRIPESSFEPNVGITEQNRVVNGEGKEMNTNGKNTAWHIPITEWDDPDRLCIAIIE